MANKTFFCLLITCIMYSSTMRSSSALAMQVTAPKSVVVIGGGIQGTSVAYQLWKRSPSSKITILEAKGPASAASGKGGGFMARSWGDGGDTEGLHHVAFDMYEKLADELGCKTYRKLPVLSVAPGKDGRGTQKAKKKLGDIMPGWLDGNVGGVNVMGYGDDTAQITPKEFVEKMLEKSGVDVIIGECVGCATSDVTGGKEITGVNYIDRETQEEKLMEADAVVVSAGPWSCAAEDWFDTVDLPMEGVKSTSIVWKEQSNVDACALFCGEDYRFNTHLEVYPRPDSTIYICGIGGSDYISTEDLKQGAFREECNAKEDRVQAASNAFKEMSDTYRQSGELDRVQACMRPCPPDAKPYMGAIPGYKGAYINAGHNCWGIAWAPASGLAMAELITEGDSSSINLKPFSPARFTRRATGGRGRKKGGEDVGEQW
jgi:glycine/D-amino acid oxidase-like deaminating enzyme